MRTEGYTTPPTHTPKQACVYLYLSRGVTSNLSKSAISNKTSGDEAENTAVRTAEGHDHGDVKNRVKGGGKARTTRETNALLLVPIVGAPQRNSHHLTLVACRHVVYRVQRSPATPLLSVCRFSCSSSSQPSLPGSQGWRFISCRTLSWSTGVTATRTHVLFVTHLAPVVRLLRCNS